MKKLIEDTLKVNEKWSRKSLTIFITFIFILALGTFITISDKILSGGKVVNIYAIQVFSGLLLFETSLMGIAEFGKKFINKNEPKGEE